MLAGDLGFIEKIEFGTAKQDISKIERMLKALMETLKNKHLTPCPLDRNAPCKPRTIGRGLGELY